MAHTDQMSGKRKPVYKGLNRRELIGGLALSFPTVATAQLLPGSISDDLIRVAGSDILSASGIGGVTGYSLRDLSTGRVLEQHQPNLPLPPASVTKIATALYGRAALGDTHRFKTHIVITGPIRNGRVEGDLILVGGGDPVMDTDGLANLAKQVARAGVKSISGKYYVYGAALPRHHQIDDSQPIDVGYNPAICGMNLNFNRVYFQWKRTDQGFKLQMTARGTKYDPQVHGIDVSLVNRSSPIFTYEKAGQHDRWSVASKALNREGSRWLPVRSPDSYAGEVFQVLAHAHNLQLPNAIMANKSPRGTVIAEEQGAEFGALMRTMLKYSTNLTAEVTGLRAAQANGNKPKNIQASSSSMSSWMRRQYGLRRIDFKNHSGLTDRTKVTAEEMVQILDIAENDGFLRSILKEFGLKGRGGKAAYAKGASVQAKTGTLNYTRGLSGYIKGKGGRKFAFAIFAADLEARRGRAKIGSKTWLRKARTQEQALLLSWINKYAV